MSEPVKRLSDVKPMDYFDVQNEFTYSLYSGEYKSTESGKYYVPQAQREILSFFKEHEYDIKYACLKGCSQDGYGNYQFFVRDTNIDSEESRDDFKERFGREARSCDGNGCARKTDDPFMTSYTVSMQDHNRDGEIDGMRIYRITDWEHRSGFIFGNAMYTDMGVDVELSGVDFQPFFSALLAAAKVDPK